MVGSTGDIWRNGLSAYGSIDRQRFEDGRLTILYVLAGDVQKASSRVRGYRIGEELLRSGHAVEFFSGASRADVLRLAVRVRRVDVVVFQKRYGRYDPILVSMARRSGATVFFDIDDHPSKAGVPSTLRNADRMMQHADAVFAGSHALMKLAGQAGGKPIFIPSGVRPEEYRVLTPKRRDRTCVGWIGNGRHYSDDLVAILRDVLGELASRRPISFRLVGSCGEGALRDAFGGIPNLDCEFVDGIDWSSPDEVSASMASFDIGVYPLLPKAFNEYKCAFKAIEYMASGLPVVASDVGANGDVVEHGKTGILANEKAQWVSAIEGLADDIDRREALGRAGRASVERNYSIASLACRTEAAFHAARAERRTA